MSLLYVLSLKPDETVKFWSISSLRITVMVRQNLNQVLLLIGVQKGEQVQGIGIHPAVGGKLTITNNLGSV